ncbi:MAG: hypothetical protein AB1796_04670 [Bacillota bacterium]
MSKLYNQPVQVRTDGETLTAFFWRGRWLLAERCERVYQRRDMIDPYYGLPTFRVKATSGGLYDLVRAREGWVLERVWD